MMSLIYRPIFGTLLNAVALYLLADLVSGVQYTGGLKFLILGGLVLMIINLTLKPLLKILSMPLVFLSGGLFYIVINVLVLWFLGYFFDVLAFQDVTLSFQDSMSYVIAALVLGILNWAQSLII